MTLWHRLRRLWDEPRIRLTDPGLRSEHLLPGDRLQIGSQLWRVEARSGTAFLLTAADGPTDRASLRLAAGLWTLATEPGGPGTVEIDPADVIHFPLRPGDDEQDGV